MRTTGYWRGLVLHEKTFHDQSPRENVEMITKVTTRISLTWSAGNIVSGSFHGLMKWFVFVHVTVEGYSTPCLGSARTDGFTVITTQLRKS